MKRTGQLKDGRELTDILNQVELHKVQTTVTNRKKDN